MLHKVDVYRANLTQATAQEIDGYTLTYSLVPCFIQPADSKEAEYYFQRGIEDVHNIYTTATDKTFQRNDILERDGNQYHVIGIQNNLMMGKYQTLTAFQYPEGAKKRLDKEAYG